MSTATKSSKPATPAHLLSVLVRLTATATVRKPVTAEAVKSDSIYLGRLVALGLVKRVGTVKTGTPGRPPVLWAPTKLGRDRARRAR